MLNTNNVNDNLETVKDDLEREEKIKQIKRELLKGLENYKKSIFYIACDAPISILCLPKTVETILLNHGLLRVYDLIDRDLAEIKGLGISRIRDLTSRLDQFISMF